MLTNVLTVVIGVGAGVAGLLVIAAVIVGVIYFRR